MYMMYGIERQQAGGGTTHTHFTTSMKFKYSCFIQHCTSSLYRAMELLSSSVSTMLWVGISQLHISSRFCTNMNCRYGIILDSDSILVEYTYMLRQVMAIHSLHLKRPALLADFVFVSRLLASYGEFYLSESLLLFNNVSLY